MGSVQSCVFVSISAYFLYVHVYRSHKRLKTEIDYNKLPTLAYLYLRYLSRAVARRKGRLDATNRCDVSYTIVNCRWASAPGAFEQPDSFWSWNLCPDQAGRPSAEAVLQRCGLRMGLPGLWVQRPPAVLPRVSLLQTSAHGTDWWTVRAQSSRSGNDAQLLFGF